MIRTSGASARADRALLWCIAISLLISLAAVVAFHSNDAHASVFSLANLVGQTAQSLTQHRGLSVTTDTMGTPGRPITFHAARMPLPSLIVALGATIFGEHSMRSTALLKALLLLCPVWFAMALVCRSARNSTQATPLFGALLVLPFACLPFLADVVNLQVEEGYTYSLLALAFALVLFTPAIRPRDVMKSRYVSQALLLGVVLALLFLSKSAMIGVVGVLLIWALMRMQHRLLQALILAAVTMAIGGWAFHQHLVSGRYSVGTSLDGLNLHKGNNAGFASRYPPHPGTSLDSFDADLSRARAFRDEWAFGDFHKNAAIAYMRENRLQTARNDMAKAEVFFVSLTRYGSGRDTGPAYLAETFSLLVFRLLFAAALLASSLGLITGGGPGRYAGGAFLALTIACALPYLAGFAYSRHASVLLYPTVLLLCRALLSERDLLP